MAKNNNLHKAKKIKDDEFYTMSTDIEKEISQYKDYFKGKKVFLNCDDPIKSAFWEYFSKNFDHLGLKKLTSTHYKKDEQTYKLELTSYEDEPMLIPLLGNGDFRNQESIDILKDSDVVVTNPPFSLMGEFIEQLEQYDKDFLIIAPLTAVSRNTVFEHFKKGEWKFGHSRINYFNRPDGSKKEVRCHWLTNIKDIKKPEHMMYMRYEGNENKYEFYDNTNVLHIERDNLIPLDYEGEMGVSIAFMTKINMEQFEITRKLTVKLNGKNMFSRIGIKHKK